MLTTKYMLSRRTPTVPSLTVEDLDGTSFTIQYALLYPSGRARTYQDIVYVDYQKQSLYTITPTGLGASDYAHIVTKAMSVCGIQEGVLLEVSELMQFVMVLAQIVSQPYLDEKYPNLSQEALDIINDSNSSTEPSMTKLEDLGFPPEDARLLVYDAQDVLREYT